ncbi:MAG TPA: KamA family radical SAM protein [Anaeromyxobacteraceae bacterium]|nr:KamA family radical SAM protein [Anaeromyxobacteraceae bacterium]
MDWRERFPGVDEADWRDWRWQLRHALRTEAELGRLVDLTPEERRGLALGGLRAGVTPYYAALADPAHPACPVRRQASPLPVALDRAPGDRLDPTGEEPHRPARAVVQKYPDRVLLLVTDTCPVYCRHCTRRRITGGEEGAFDRAAVEEGIAYVRAHPEVRDVIVSGGDPLVLSDERLEPVLAALRAIPHVRLLRLATRAPVVLPMRVDARLAATLRRLAPLYVVTHFNHPKELTPDARAACELLVDHGVPVENQSVLLRGLNSSARTLGDLFETLLTWRVRPYYLHQGDLAAGTAHLRTPLAAGVGLLRQLRGRLSGLAIPHLAVDLPDGSGKITLAPDYTGHGGFERGEGGTWLVNHRGERVLYPDPPSSDCDCPYDAVYYGAGASPVTGPAGR